MVNQAVPVASQCRYKSRGGGVFVLVSHCFYSFGGC